jgi:L-ascorbate metabolism protein UlaG (beta-lactamase superfamily)
MVKAMSHNDHVEYDTLIQTRAPKAFANALSRAAARRMVTRSDYIRMTLADRLKIDGVEIAAGAA